MAEEIARSLEGSDLKWMREAGGYLRDGNGTIREKATCHYAIPQEEYRSLVRLGLVAKGTVLLTDLGVHVAAILRGDDPLKDSADGDSNG